VIVAAATQSCRSTFPLLLSGRFVVDAAGSKFKLTQRTVLARIARNRAGRAIVGREALQDTTGGFEGGWT
jgi:hypothetical protein